MNRVNLRLLAGWLLDNSSDLIKTNAFDMLSFRRNAGGVCDFVSKTDCGTVGCALGWSPVSGIPSLSSSPKDFTKVTFSHTVGATALDFDKYCTRVFGIGHSSKEGDAHWLWCFDEEWGELDNTPRGAAIRIMYLLSRTEEVVEWEDIGPDFGEVMISKYMAWWDAEGKQEW